MKGYWNFALVGLISLIAALVWAQLPGGRTPTSSPRATTTLSAAPGPDSDYALTSVVPASNSPAGTAAVLLLPPVVPQPKPPALDEKTPDSQNNKDDGSLPDSSSALPLLAVLGFGILAGGITSAMRTR
jgi:hypothetical protein